jgi:ethanolamine transporter EutH
LACATVAAFVGQPAWAAAAGAGLVLVYWALEALTWWRARDRRDLALGVALGGMGVRIAVVLIGLVIIGVLDRPAFPAAALSFLAVFTLYILVRPFTYPTAPAPVGQARLQ